MQLILAIDADRRQTDELSALVAKRLAGVELIQATSAGEALQALGDRVPDLILTSALLSPFDDGVLAEYLRDLGPSAAHVQALRIPVLGTPKPTVGSRFSFGRKKRPVIVPDGCDPNFFADEISVYLARAVEEQQAASESRMDVDASSSYDDVDRASFDFPAHQPEDVAPVYVPPTSSDIGSDFRLENASSGVRPEDALTFVFPATADGSTSLAEAREAFVLAEEEEQATDYRVEDNQAESFPQWNVVASEAEPFAYQPAVPENVEPILVDTVDTALLEPHITPQSETVVGVAPLAASGDQVDPDLFVLDASSVAEQSVFDLDRMEPVEEESRVGVYALDEPYVIPPVETEPSSAALSDDQASPFLSQQVSQPAHDYQLLSVEPPLTSVVDDPSSSVPPYQLSDVQLDAPDALLETVPPMAAAESDSVVEQLNVEEVPTAPETQAPSSSGYRLEPSHVRVKSRSTVAFESALAAIRKAWGKPRRSQQTPEPALRAEPASEPSTRTNSAADLTPEEVAPQFFDVASSTPIQSGNVGHVAEQPESDPLVVELPVFEEPIAAATASLIEVSEPMESLAQDLNYKFESSTVATTELPPQAIEPAVPIITEVELPDVGLRDTAPRTAVASSTEKPVSAALVDRLIRAVLTKAPITSVLADRSEPSTSTEPLTASTRADAGAAVEPFVRVPLPEPHASAPTVEMIPLEEPVVDEIPDAATRAALEVDLTRDINALETEDVVQGSAEAGTAVAQKARPSESPVTAAPQFAAATQDDDVYELDATTGYHDLESEIAAAAPPRPIRESLPKNEATETNEPVQAQSEPRQSDKPKKKGDKRKAAAKTQTPNNRPPQDEWGLFDPSRCGFAALVDKLNEVADEEDPKAGQTTVRVISYR